MAKRFIEGPGKESPDLDDEELDAIKSLLICVLMENTSLNSEDIYSFIYGNGRKIIWN